MQSGMIPLVVEFEVDESRTIKIRGWFRDDPSVNGQVTLNCQNIPRENLHLIERTEVTLNAAGERVRPEEKARANKKKQALIDLCEQFASRQSDDIRKQIIDIGNELKSEVKAIEQKYKL